jgi:hypothetical protein
LGVIFPRKITVISHPARRGANFFCNEWENDAMARVTINLYNLWVEIEDDTAYPDHISDLSSRVLHLYQSAIEYAKKAEVDITKLDFAEWEDDDE